jgi:uncharacterized cupin superfamily protein
MTWWRSDDFGATCFFEGERGFPEVGVRLKVLAPGQPNGMYHSENQQEDFLVLAGECLLLVEGEERKLRPWDFVHCPPETNHMVVGAGHGLAVVLAVGARPRRNRIVYPVDPLASRHGVAVAQETTKRAEAYAGFPRRRRSRYRAGWLPE